MQQLAVLLLAGADMVLAQTDKFNAPWKETSTAIIIDPFEGNSVDWEKLARDKRVVGIIHRATQGHIMDRKYKTRKTEAKKRKYRWGSYHLGLPGDPIKQADFYLHIAQPADDDMLALDIESVDPQLAMSLDDARRFLLRVKERTGRLPLLYGNQSVVKRITERFGQDDVFSRTGLWYARFRPQVKDFPHGTWMSYTLWQFSSEVNCKAGEENRCMYRVPGTKTDMDVNVYNGSIEEAKSHWPFNVHCP